MDRHFEGSYKKHSLKPSVVCLPIVILAGLALSFRANLQGSSANDLPFGHPIQKPELSCEQVLKIAEWGQKRFGGIGEKDVFNPQRAEAVAKIFVEKLDPNKMLFSQRDLVELQKISKANWDSLIRTSSCEPWQHWLELNYIESQQRISSWIRNYNAPKRFQPSSGKQRKSRGYDKEKSYPHFASSVKELEIRWQKELTQLLFESDEAVLMAYQKNVSQLLRDKVEQKYFENFPEGRGLLAKALLGGLDPYSTYFSSREFTDFYEELKGTSAGLGLQLEKVPQGFLVQKVVENSPADKSNKIHEGDIIESVDEVNLDSLSFEDAKRLLKGPENSIVRIGLGCQHGNSEHSASKKIEISLERGQFELEETKINLSWKTPSHSETTTQKVAVISIPAFYGRGGMESGKEEKSVSEDLKKRISDELLNESSHVGMVLDLRGNPGGYLEEAVSMGSLFVGGKPIVGVVEEGLTRVLKDEASVGALYQKPLVVLVDNGSASAAEVLSGALKDYQRAVIVGTSRTYGKGTVQKLFNLEDPLLSSDLKGTLGLSSLGIGVVKLTTSVFYSPLGHTPANGGVTADIILSKNPEVEALSNRTQDIHPIVDQKVLKALELSSKQHQGEIQYLVQRSQERLSQSLTAEKDHDLEEAVAIASDMASLKSF